MPTQQKVTYFDVEEAGFNLARVVIGFIIGVVIYLFWARRPVRR